MLELPRIDPPDEVAVEEAASEVVYHEVEATRMMCERERYNFMMGDFGRMVYWVDDRTQSGRATMEGIVLSLVSMVEVGRGIVEAVGEVLR